MRGRDILNIVVFLPFLAYAYFSFTGKIAGDLNVLYLIAVPLVASIILLLSKRLWFLIFAVLAVNLSVQLTGASSSQLFFFYFLLLFIEGLRVNHWRYMLASALVLILETVSAVFHIQDPGFTFPFGTLAAFVGFSAIIYLFLRREKRHSDILSRNLEREQAKFHWIDPLTGPREERLKSLKEKTYAIDADALYTGFAEFVFATLEVHTAAIFLVHGKDLQLVAACSRSQNLDSDASLKLGEGLVGYLARERKETLTNDLGRDAERLGYYVKPELVSAVAAAPIVSGNETYGIVVIDARRKLTEYDLGFISNMASLVARDIQVAAAYEERHREALRFSGLYELAGDLLTGMSEEELIDKSFGLVRELFAPDAMGFARLSGSGEGQVKRYEPGKDFEKDYRFDAERSLVAMVAKHMGFLNHRDMSKPGLYRMGPGEKAPDNRSFLGIGFEEDAQTHGVLWMEKEEADAYSERDGKVLGFASTLLSAAFLRVHYQDELSRLARLDGLTGLLNHRTFQEELEKAVNEAATVGLFIIDLDHFKQFNDTYGHPVGDMVLGKIAEVIADKGIAARYGGEEFALIVPNVLSQQMLGKGEEVLAAVRRMTVKIREGTLKVTASVGGAIYPKDAKTREDLVRAADSALYQAKSGGRDRLVLFDK